MGSILSLDEEEGENKADSGGVIDSFFSKLMELNLCLRPQYQSEELTNYLKSFDAISLYNDPYYGECFALENKDTMNYSVMIKYVEDEKGYRQKMEKYAELLRVSEGANNNNILKAAIVTDFLKRGFFFLKHEVYVVYDYILVDLEKEFENRVVSDRRFSEDQIKTILKQVTKGFGRLELTNYSSVRMCHIYFCKNGLEIKVAHPDLFFYESNLKILCRDYEQKNIYLAPEELESLERDDKEANHGWLANSYSLGMIVLSLMSMRHMNQVYDYRACEIDFQRVDQNLKACSGNYSFKFIQLVDSLLKRKPVDRLSIKTLSLKLDQKFQIQQPIELTLIEKKEQEFPILEYQRDLKLYKKQEELKPFHTNYLEGLIHPKVGFSGQYFYMRNKEDNNESKLTNEENNRMTIVANSRLRYSEKNKFAGQYIGDSNKLNYENADQIMREGKGMYHYKDGQIYIGEWHRGKMEGFGKLYWAEHQIRYEGQFKEGFFHGQGTEYAHSQIKLRENQIDQNYIKIFKGNWLKYQGSFKNDQRQGAGKIYFRKGYWIGNFKKGQPNGEGIFYSTDSQKKPLKGVWKDGQNEHFY